MDDFRSGGTIWMLLCIALLALLGSGHLGLSPHNTETVRDLAVGLGLMFLLVMLLQWAERAALKSVAIHLGGFSAVAGSAVAFATLT